MGHSPEDSLNSSNNNNNTETAAAAVVSDDEGSITNHHYSSDATTPQQQQQRQPLQVPPRTPLQFKFRGYSVWLELEQVANHDLDRALDVAAHELHVQRVPYPHVTVEYGIELVDGGGGAAESSSSCEEHELRHRFRQYCCCGTNKNAVLDAWPALTVRGVQTGSTYDGVDGEDMTMAWIELTLATSPAHEIQVQAVRQALWGDQYQSPTHPKKWTPHLSLCYENPEQAQSNLHYSLNLLQRVPTLTSLPQRRVIGMALWKTQGKMEDWKCLERIVLEEEDPYCDGSEQQQQQEDPMMVGA